MLFVCFEKCRHRISIFHYNFLVIEYLTNLYLFRFAIPCQNGVLKQIKCCYWLMLYGVIFCVLTFTFKTVRRSNNVPVRNPELIMCIAFQL